MAVIGTISAPWRRRRRRRQQRQCHRLYRHQIAIRLAVSTNFDAAPNGVCKINAAQTIHGCRVIVVWVAVSVFRSTINMEVCLHSARRSMIYLNFVSGCDNYHPDCEMWAAVGSCQTNPWMLENCRASCQSCLPQEFLRAECRLAGRTRTNTFRRG